MAGGELQGLHQLHFLEKVNCTKTKNLYSETKRKTKIQGKVRDDSVQQLKAARNTMIKRHSQHTTQLEK